MAPPNSHLLQQHPSFTPHLLPPLFALLYLQLHLHYCFYNGVHDLKDDEDQHDDKGFNGPPPTSHLGLLQ
jgi:hypothetical protein